MLLLFGCSQPAVKSTHEKTVDLIAHRGANNVAPEHTITAYKKAIQLGADFIEIDLRMTKDGHLVAIHDETVDRTTDGKGAVSSYTLEELQKLDAGVTFGEEFKGEKIPTIEEIIDQFDDSTKYYIETRLVDKQPIMEEKLINILSEKGVIDRVIIGSFSQTSLRKVHEIDSDIPLVLTVVGDETINNIDVNKVKEFAIGIAPYAPQINKDFVNKMHESDLEVHVWFDNSNEKEYISNVISYGVDAVFTDFLDNTLEVMSQVISKQ